MAMIDSLLDRIGRLITRVLNKPASGYEPYTPSDPQTLGRVLQPADVLLIEGNQKLSAAIKYLTQSTWSHAAIFVGDEVPEPADGSERPRLIEANLGEGVVAVPLSKYASYNTRICRPVGLTLEDRAAIVAYAVDRIGHHYDTRNIIDLARYLIPTPPVPIRWRRRMIALGSGDPTRAICSTLIAQAFQHVRYPILPLVSLPDDPSPRVRSTYSRREILHIRHHSLFAPRDFDVSPFFEIVKPTLVRGFDYKELQWGDLNETGESTLGSGVAPGLRGVITTFPAAAVKTDEADKS
jgi:hypothetical protein